MITLKTLPQTSAQEVFDQVATHLLTQKKHARDIIARCAYRGKNNTKCAAGCLISDDEYVPEMDNVGDWYNMVVNEYAPERHKELIQSLQRVHDNASVGDWKQQLKDVASNYDLTFSVIRFL